MKISRGPRQGRQSPRETAVCVARGFLTHVLENPFQTSAHFFQFFFLVMQLYTVEYNCHESQDLNWLPSEIIYGPHIFGSSRGSPSWKIGVRRRVCVPYTRQ